MKADVAFFENFFMKGQKKKSGGKMCPKIIPYKNPKLDALVDVLKKKKKKKKKRQKHHQLISITHRHQFVLRLNIVEQQQHVVDGGRVQRPSLRSDLLRERGGEKLHHS